jgi:hypothetical protein
MPNTGNFWLGQDQNFARDLSDQYRQQGSNLIQSGRNAQQRAPAFMDWMGANRNYWLQAGARRQAGAITDDLRNMANQQRQGPSAAERQLQTGGNENANLAISTSQVGGGSTASARNAAFAAMRANNAAAQQGNVLRAQQQASDRDFRGQALGQVGQLQNQALGQDLAERQQDIGFWQQQAQLHAQGASQNDAMTLGLSNLGIGSQQMGTGINIEQLGAMGELENMREKAWTQTELANIGVMQANRAAEFELISGGVGAGSQLLNDAIERNSRQTQQQPVQQTGTMRKEGGGYSGAPSQMRAEGGGYAAEQQATAPSTVQTGYADEPAPEPPPLPQAGELAGQVEKKGAYARVFQENPANFWLGGSPNFARDQADALRGQGADFWLDAAGVQRRGAPQIHGDAPERTMGNILQAAGGVDDATAQMRALSRQGPGASAAEAQMVGAQQTNASNAIAAAAAGGGGTFGNYAAGQQGIAQGGSLVDQAAMARAGEFDRHRQGQAGNLVRAAGLQQQLRQSGLAQRSQDFGFEAGNAALRNQQAAANDRLSLGLGGLGLQSQQLAGTLDSAQLRALMQQEALRSRARLQTRIGNVEAYQREKAASANFLSSLFAAGGTVAGGLTGGPGGAAVGGAGGREIGKVIGSSYSGGEPNYYAPYDMSRSPYA